MSDKHAYWITDKHGNHLGGFKEHPAAIIKRLEDERDDAQTDYAVVGSNLNAAYRERAHLVALLAAQYPAELREDPEDEDGQWSIVYIDLPTGQASWHIHPRDMDLFPHVKFGTDAEWDGHSTDEKYRRIDELTARLHAEGGIEAVGGHRGER